MKTELKRFNDNGEIITLGEIAEVNGKLVGDTELAQKILARPIYDPVNRREFTEKDGDDFLQMLHRSLCSAYLWATKPA